MCSPVMLLAGAGMGTSGIGTFLGIKSAMQAGKFNKEMSNYQSKMNSARAARALQNGEVQQNEAAARRKQLIATGLTEFAANGLLIDAGPASAPAVWEQDQAAELAYDRLAIKENAEAEAWGFESQAKLDKTAGAMASHQGQLSAWAQGIGFAGSSMSTAAMMAPTGGGGGSGGGKLSGSTMSSNQASSPVSSNKV